MDRDSLREILHNEFDEEFENRFVGKKKKAKHRTPLKAFGPWHQEHSDGHEKLSEQGLDIGIGIHLPIYGSKDQWSSFVHALLLMPNVRNRTAIAHYYLDLVEARDCELYILSILCSPYSFFRSHNISTADNRSWERSGRAAQDT